MHSIIFFDPELALRKAKRGIKTKERVSLFKVSLISDTLNADIV